MNYVVFLFIQMDNLYVIQLISLLFSSSKDMHILLFVYVISSNTVYLLPYCFKFVNSYNQINTFLTFEAEGRLSFNHLLRT